MSAHSDPRAERPVSPGTLDRQEKTVTVLAVIWIAALLALIPGAATSNGFSIATSLIIMGVAPIVSFLVCVVAAVQSSRSKRTATP